MLLHPAATAPFLTATIGTTVHATPTHASTSDTAHHTAHLTKHTSAAQPITLWPTTGAVPAAAAAE